MTIATPPPRLRRRALALAGVLGIALSACAPQAAQEEAASGTDAAAEAAADGTARSESATLAPGASPDVAAGVAIAYSAAFRLPDAAVADAQERHVQACRNLGGQRCRMTGISYHRSEDGIVDASLSFLVDPALARGFTREAEAVVTALEGELLSAQVGGDDVGSAIQASQQTSARLGGDINRLRQRLREPGLTAGERQDLQARISQLEEGLSDEEATRRNGENRLSATPVEFSYQGQRGFGGINPDRPFASAWEASTSSFASFGALLLMVLGVALPWSGLAIALLLAVRWAKRRNARLALPAAQEPAGG